jgi:hypothetical protein
MLGLDAMSKFKPPKIDSLWFESLAQMNQALKQSQAQIHAPSQVARQGQTQIQAVGQALSQAVKQGQAQIQALKQMDIPATLQNALNHLASAFSDAKKAEAALQAGWVPFTGMPIDQFDANTPSDKINSLFEQHTCDEWPHIKDQLWESVKSSGVDDEALATYDEALRAHEAGLFRSVVRVLFPEIERVARETVYQGERREEPKKRGQRATLTTSLEGFREAVYGKMPAGIVTNIKFGIAFTNKMYKHLYELVGEDEASSEKFKADPVPNRHASQHGYVNYSSNQNSFNTLAMAAFMFQIIMATKAYMENSVPETRRICLSRHELQDTCIPSRIPQMN